MRFGRKEGKQRAEGPGRMRLRRQSTGEGLLADQGRAKASARFRKRLLTAACSFLVGVLLAIPIPFVNNPIGYVPLIAYLFALLLSWVYLRVLKSGLEFDQKGGGEGCLRGDALHFEFTVNNRSVLPAVSVGVFFFVSDLFGNERESVRRSVGLPPRSSKTFNFAVKFDHIGTYGVGIREIDVTDPFGIFHHVREFEDLQQVNVQPRIVKVVGLEISTEASKESNKAVITVIDDGMDYCGVREYRWGDPIKSIHWKLSSRIPEGEYFTRLYETSCNPGLALVIDCDSFEYASDELMDVYDGVVESALSVELWASKLAYETELLFVDRTGRRRRFEGPLSERYGEILERLPRINPGDGRAVLDILRFEASSIYAQDNIIVCTSHVTDELVGELLRVKAGRRYPVVIAVIPRTLDADVRKQVNARLSRLAAAGVGCIELSRAAELEGSV